MSKPRTSWVSNESPASSSKQNQQTIDYMTPGVPVWSFAFTAYAPTPSSIDNYQLGFYPHSPSKSVYNRLRIIGAANVSGVDDSLDYEISFDSGSTWTAAFPSASVAPVSLMSSAVTYVEDWNLDAQVTSFQYIGIRCGDMTALNDSSAVIKLFGFLFNITDNPF